MRARRERRRAYEKGVGLPVARARRRLAQAEEALATALVSLEGGEGLEPIGCVVDNGIVRLDHRELFDGGNAVSRQMPADVALLQRVEVEVDCLNGSA